MKLPIRLDHFLKAVGIAQTGGHAKILIQSGDIEVNNTVETRRGRKLQSGDKVRYEDQSFVVSAS